MELFSRSRLVTIAGLLFISSTMYAQLNIVGVNSEKPSSNIDYLNSPVRIDNLFQTDYRLTNSLEGVLPAGQLIYNTTFNQYGFRSQKDSIIFGLPVGYYKFTGMLITSEEVKPFYDAFEYLRSNFFDYWNKIEKKQGIEEKLSNPKLSKKERKILTEELESIQSTGFNLYFAKNDGSYESVELFERQFKANEKEYEDIWQIRYSDFWGLYRVINDVLLTGYVRLFSNSFISTEELKEAIAKNDSPRINSILYELEDSVGNIYYISALKAIINVEYVNTLNSLFKGKDVYFIKSSSNDQRIKLFEYYEERDVTPDDKECGIWNDISESPYDQEKNNLSVYDFALKVGNLTPFKCEDILIDGSNILAVISKGRDRYTIKLAKYIEPHKFKDVTDDEGHILFSYDLAKINIEHPRYTGSDNISLTSAEQIGLLKADSEKALKIVRAKKKETEAIWAKNQAAHKDAVIAKYGSHYGEKILQHKLELGMTSEMVIESIGYPSRVIRSKNNQADVILFCYSDIMVATFVEDKLQSVTSSLELY